VERLKERLTVHTYNESLAEEIYHQLPAYADFLEAWLVAMASRLQSENLND